MAVLELITIETARQLPDGDEAKIHDGQPFIAMPLDVSNHIRDDAIVLQALFDEIKQLAPQGRTVLHEEVIGALPRTIRDHLTDIVIYLELHFDLAR